jgi:hypothetical protein
MRWSYVIRHTCQCHVTSREYEWGGDDVLGTTLESQSKFSKLEFEHEAPKICYELCKVLCAAAAPAPTAIRLILLLLLLLSVRAIYNRLLFRNKKNDSAAK